jgi:hypothetical protein
VIICGWGTAKRIAINDSEEDRCNGSDSEGDGSEKDEIPSNWRQVYLMLKTSQGRENQC